MDKIQTTDITKQIIKDIEEKNNNKGFIAVFLEKNDKEFIINKHYQIKIELDKTKSIYIYDINYKLLGIVYRDFFDNELKEDNIYTNINILNYNVSIPIQSNKDILILDTNLYNCNNKINSKILKNKISCILEN